MTIHREHPFLDPSRDPVRAFRGRLVSGVTLWAAGQAGRRVGLTVSSVLLVAGEVPRVVALLDPLSDLAETLLEQRVAALSVLETGQQFLAEVFAGLAPAPGGPFEAAAFGDTEWGPVLASAATWAGLRLESSREIGYSIEVCCVLERFETGPEVEPLVHYRGNYRRLGQ